MFCLWCGKKLRGTKRIDFVGREYHFSCIERMRKKEAEQLLEELLELLRNTISNRIT